MKITGHFLVNNYKQAVSLLDGKHTLVKTMHDLSIADETVFDMWLEEEKAYLLALSKEPLIETMEMEYYQKLVNLRDSRCVYRIVTCQLLTRLLFNRESLSTAQTAWNAFTPDFQAANAAPVSATGTTAIQPAKKPRGLEAKRRHAIENVDKDLLIVQQLEEKLDINERWTPAHPKWKLTSELVGKRRYQRCLDSLEGLIVARMFELTKMNMSQTGEPTNFCCLHDLVVNSRVLNTLEAD